MAEVTEYRIQQIVDNGQVVQMTLAEDVHTEPVSQKQMIMDSACKKIRSGNERTSCAYYGSNTSSTTNNQSKKLSAHRNYHYDAKKQI